jgi:AcrR family transcriptional regulator
MLLRANKSFMNDVSSLDPRILDLFEFRPRKGDLKKLEIIQAAIDCLAELGLENTNYEAIAQRLQTRRAHIAYHFGEKNQIFLAAVKYILGTYQQTLVDALTHVKDQNDAQALLRAYINAAFDWAEQEPKQLQCMLLLYYMCTLHPEFLDLHHQVRLGGTERLSYLISKSNPGIKPSEAARKAKTLQNLLSGTLLDTVTTHGITFKQARSNTLKSLDFIL